eukprot:gene11499-13413_t
MDPDLLLAIALSESLMVRGGEDASRSSSSNSDHEDDENNNNGDKADQKPVVDKEPAVDLLQIYFTELTQSLKNDKLTNLVPLFKLTKTDLCATHIHFITKIFDKNAIDFCLKTLERWCEGDVDINNSVSMTSSNIKASTPLVLLSIIDMLCCIEFPSSLLDKSFFDKIPSFDSIQDSESFFATDDPAAAAESTTSSTTTSATAKTTTTAATTGEKNIFNQFLANGLRNESLELHERNQHGSTASHLEEEDVNEELVKSNSTYFNKTLKGPSRLLSICSRLFVPYQTDVVVSELFEEFRVREQLIYVFVNNIQDILFSEGFETLDVASIPWTIDLIGRLIGTLRSYQAYNLQNQTPLVKSKLLTSHTFENLFQVLGTKLNCPDLKTKAEIFFSLCILSDIQSMHIDLDEIMSKDSFAERDYLCWSPQLVILAINLAFDNIDSLTQLDKADSVIKTLFGTASSTNSLVNNQSTTITADNQSPNRPVPVTKFVNNIHSTNNNQTTPTTFDYLEAKQYTVAELCAMFVTPQLLDSVFSILYISYFKLREVSHDISVQYPPSTPSHTTTTSNINTSLHNSSSSGATPLRESSKGTTLAALEDEGGLFGSLFHEPLSASASAIKTPGPLSPPVAIPAIATPASVEGSALGFASFLNELLSKASSAPLLTLVGRELKMSHARVLLALLHCQSQGVSIDMGNGVLCTGPLIPSKALTGFLQSIAFQFIKNDCISEAMESRIIDAIIKQPQPTIALPSVIPREQLTLLGWLFVKRQSRVDHPANDSIVIALWDDFITRVSRSLTTAPVYEFREVLSLDFIYLLLFTFHTLDEKHRCDILKHMHAIALQVITLNASETRFVPHALLFTRFIFILNYVVFNFGAVSSRLSSLFYDTILSSGSTGDFKDTVVSMAVLNHRPQLEQLNLTTSEGEAPIFFDLCFSTGTWLSSSTVTLEELSGVLGKCEIDYSLFHKTIASLCTLLPAPVSSPTTPQQSILASLYYDYLVATSCMLIGALPPSTAFIEVIKDKTLFATLSNESLVYLSFLKSTMSSDSANKDLIHEIPWNCHSRNILTNLVNISLSTDSKLRVASIIQAGLAYLTAVFDRQENVKMDSEYFEGWESMFDQPEKDDESMDASDSPSSNSISALSEMLPLAYESLTKLIATFKQAYKLSLTSQLQETDAQRVALVKECFLYSEKSDVMQLIDALEFSSSDRSLVDRWGSEIKIDVGSPIMKLGQRSSFLWIVHPCPQSIQSTASLGVLSAQQLLKTTALFADALSAIPSTDVRLPPLKLALSHERVALNTDNMLSFDKDAQFIEVSSSQLAILVNNERLCSFERLARAVLALPPSIRAIPALDTILCTQLDNVLAIARAHPQHIYTHYLGNGAALDISEDKQSSNKQLGDISLLFSLAASPSSQTVTKRALATLLQIMSTPIPDPGFTSSLRASAISALMSLPRRDLCSWLSEKLLGSTAAEDAMDTGAPKLTPSTVALQELVIRLVGHLIGNKEFASFSLTPVAPPTETIVDSDEEEPKKKKKTAKKRDDKKSTSSPVIAPVAPSDLDWNESVPDMAPLLHELLLEFFPSAFGVWIDHPSLLRAYFGLLQVIAVRVHRLVDVFSAVARLESPLLVAPTTGQLESLDLLVDFVASFLKMFTPESPATVPTPCSHSTEVSAAPTAPGEPIGLVDDEEEDEDDEDEFDARDWRSTSKPSASNDDEDETDGRRLASKLCTYTATKNDYIDQHWYFCYTCNLKFSEGCCSVCVNVCHKGHAVSYSRFSRFFCDCGAGAGKGGPCKALKARPYQPSKSTGSQAKDDASAFSSASHTSASQPPRIRSVFDDIPSTEKADMSSALTSVDGQSIVAKITALYPKLIALYRAAIPTQQVQATVKHELFTAGNERKEMVTRNDLFSQKKATKNNTFEAKLKGDGSDNTLKNLLSSGHVQRRALASNTRGIVALAEGENVSLVNVAKLLDDDSTVDKAAFKTLSKSAVGFPIVSLVFNSANERYLAVSGHKECKILTINQKDEIVDTLVIDLSLYALGENIHIIKVEWLPGSQVELAVVTNEFIKIYDLSTDNISPAHFYTLVEDSIRDATVVANPASGNRTIIALAESGMLYAQIITPSIDDESCIMIETLSIPTLVKLSAGVTLYYAADLDMLLTTFTNGEVHALRLEESNGGLTVTNSIYINDPNLKLPMPVSAFTQLSPNYSNIFTALSARGGYLVTLKITPTLIGLQSIKMTPKVEGLTWVNKAAPKLLVLFEDGSLVRYDYALETPLTAPAPKAVPAALSPNNPGIDVLAISRPQPAVEVAVPSSSSQQPAAGPEFPIDFFEKVECITPSIKFGGDALSSYSSDVVKQRLASNDEYIVCANVDSLSLVCHNTNPDNIICGIRVLVGNASLKHIPKELKVLDRSIEITNGMRRWYDIALTPEESYKSAKQLTLTATATFNPGNAPIIDSVEVYARSKESSGWSDLAADHKSSSRNSVQSSSSNSTESVLLHALTSLANYFGMPNATSSAHSKEVVEQLPAIMTDTGLAFLQPSAKALLKILLPSHEDYLALKHSTLLSYASTSVSRMLNESTINEADQESLDHIIRVLKKISCSRPNNLVTGLFSSRPTFLGDLMAVYRNATQSGANNLAGDQIVSNISHLLWNCLRSKSFSTNYIFDLIKGLLSHSLESVRTRTALSFVALIGKAAPEVTLTAPVTAKMITNAAAVHPEDIVLYSCDICSVSPIQTTRWHCEVCGDFDLCDVCYHAMREAEGHDPTHKFIEFPPATATTTDEPMKDVAREDEPMLDYDEELRRTIEMSHQGAPTTTTDRPMEDAEEEEDPLILLFGHMLTEFASSHDKGFAITVPYSQMLHALFIHLNSKILSTGHIDRFVNLVTGLLDRPNLDLNKHLTTKSNTLDGDTMIIQLLSILLDTEEHKHLKSKDSKPVAATILSQHMIYSVSELLAKKNFVGILEKWLSTVFNVISEGGQSANDANPSPFGALLVNSQADDQTLPKQRFVPFFSKSLPTIPATTHTILAKSLFKLAITFFRCDRRNKKTMGDQHVTVFARAAWTPLVCGYIHSKKTVAFVKHPKKLLLLLCTTKSAYYSVRDEYLLKKKYAKIVALERLSSGFIDDIHYDHLIKLINYLTSMLEVASNRPHSWQYFCQNNDVLVGLYNNLFFLPSESSSLILELLTYAFVQEEHNDDENNKENNDNKKDTIMNDVTLIAKHIPIFLEGNSLDTMINNLLLEPNSSDLRINTSNFLYYLWKSSNIDQKKQINRILWNKLDQVVSYGKNSTEFMELLTYFVNEIDANSWKDQYDEFAENLNSILELDGYYLESEPCLVCNNPEVQFQTYRLDALKQEVKFTESAQLIKFNGVYSIQKLTINVHDVKKARMIKTINLYYNNKNISDIGELKGKFAQWKKLKQVHFTPGQVEKTIRFQVPIAATNFMIEYFDFHDNAAALATEKLQCPRCSRTVADRHGICKHCHENAFQCKQCRNINYENLEAFLCNECGFCKHARFEYAFTCKPTVAIEKIETADDYKRAVATIDKESENAHKKYQRLMGFKKLIANLITSFQTQEPWPKEELLLNSLANATATAANPSGSAAQAPASSTSQINFSSLRINRKIGYLSRLYEKECKTIFEGLSKSVQILLNTRMEILKYMNTLEKRPRTRESKPRATSTCFGCSNSFSEQALAFLNHLSRNTQLIALRTLLVEKGVTRELFSNNIHQGKSDSRNNARLAIASLTRDNSEATRLLGEWINTKVDYVIENHSSVDLPTMISSEMSLLRECSTLSDSIWQARLRFVMTIFFRAIESGSNSPVISEHIILPCLKIVLSLCSVDRVQGAESVSSVKSADQSEDQKNLQAKLERLRSRKSPVISPSSTPVDASASSSTTVRTADSPSNVGLRISSLLNDASTYFDAAEPNVKYDDWISNDTFEAWSAKYSGAIFAEAPANSPSSASSAVVSPSDKETFRREVRSRFLAGKYAAKWRARSQKSTPSEAGPLDGLFEDAWIKRLLFNSTASIRIETFNLMNVLARSSPVRTLRFLDMFEKMIPHATLVGEYSAEFFALFNLMITSDERKIYLTVRGFLPYLCDLIVREIERISAMETSFNTDVSQGFVLKTLVSILSAFVDVPSLKAKMKRDNLIEKVLDAFLSLRCIIIQKNKLTEDTVRQLQDIMKALNSSTSEDNKAFMAANIKALGKHSQNGRTPLFILEQICNIVCPVKPEPVYNLILTKASTQEEYIRGAMNKNPYPSSTVGPLMRDVKNKICKTLDLGSFLDDDNGMELLVDNKIIKLDLPIRRVYEQVWKRSAQAQRAHDTNIPMTVVYRLQGLDGEATEELIESLSDSTGEERDPEEEFEVTSVMATCGGLDAMLAMLERIGDFVSERELAHLTIKLLASCAKLKVNREQLLTINAVGRLLETLKKAFHQADLAESLLLIIEAIVSEANRSYLSDSSSSTSASIYSHHKNIQEAQEQMSMFLDRLTSPLVRSNASIIQAMTRVIPFLTYGHDEVMQALVDFFVPSLQFEEYDTTAVAQRADVTTYMDFFTKIADATRPDDNGYKLRSLVLARGITATLYQYVDTHFPADKDKNSTEWLDALAKPALPYVMVLLKGLANGHAPTQDLALSTDGFIQRLHLMEQTSTVAKIGTLAENLLDALKQGNEKVGAEVDTIRNESRTEKMKQAEKHREVVLKELGLAQQGKHITAKHVPGSIEDLEDEEGFTCMVCREGYSFKPDDVLGIYTYAKRIPLLPINETTATNVSSSGSSSSGVSYGYTTVTHFNIIHYFCHRDATKADKGMKVPKEEWEGAALRNQQTKCNNIFPIQGPRITNDALTPYCDKYWTNLNNIARFDGPRFRLLAHDLKLLLVRFAKDESFSQDSKGGGKESNIRIIPFFVQFGMFLLDQKIVGSAGNQLRRPHFDKIFNQFLTLPIESLVTTMSQSDNVPYYLVLSIFLQSAKDWKTSRFNLLNRILVYSFVEYLSSPSAMSSSDPTSSASLFSIIRPWLLFYSLVDKFHELLKPSTLPPSTTTTVTSPSASTTEPWVNETKVYLASHYTKIQQDCKSLLSAFEDELKSYEDESEFFDDLGLLKEVLDQDKTASAYILNIYNLVKTNLKNNK